MPESHSPHMIEQSRCPKCVLMRRCRASLRSRRLNVQSANWPTRRWQRTNETENTVGWLKSEPGRGE